MLRTEALRQLTERGSNLRVVLVILVLMLLVDAFFYNGNYTQSAYQGLKLAADQFVAFIRDVVQVGPEGDS